MSQSIDQKQLVRPERNVRDNADVRDNAPLDDAAVMAAAGDLRALVGKLRRKMSEQASAGDFTSSQTSTLLRLLNHGPATLTILANAEGMRPQSMSAIIAVLEGVGFVSGAPDPADGRRTILSITPLAVETVKAGRAAKDDWLFGAIRAKLDPAEQVELAHSLTLLQRLLAP